MDEHHGYQGEDDTKPDGSKTKVCVARPDYTVFIRVPECTVLMEDRLVGVRFGPVIFCGAAGCSSCWCYVRSWGSWGIIIFQLVPYSTGGMDRQEDSGTGRRGEEREEKRGANRDWEQPLNPSHWVHMVFESS